jgi:hypothetical protein
VSDASRRVARFSPWFLGNHALLTLDDDPTDELEPWSPPPLLDENTYGFPNRAFTKVELVSYIDYCRARVHRTLDALSDDAADRPLPSAHRHHGTWYGVLVGSMPLHVREHASQIRQFLTDAGSRVQPMPGDRGYVV